MNANERSESMGFIFGGVLLLLGIMAVKYGLETIVIGLTILAIAFGLKRD